MSILANHSLNQEVKDWMSPQKKGCYDNRYLTAPVNFAIFLQ